MQGTIETWLKSEDGVRVHASKTAYVARITGTDPEYDWEREFLTERNRDRDSYSGKHVGKVLPDGEVTEGEIYEVRHDSHGNRRRRFYRVSDVERDEFGQIESIEAEKLDMGPEVAVEEGWDPDHVL